MKAYIDLLTEILETGTDHDDRTGTGTLRIWGAMIKHNLQDGFPLLTTKMMAVKSATTELLGFIRGETDVRWYQERGCRVWDGDHARWHGADLKADKERLRADPTNEILLKSIAHRELNPHSLGAIYGAVWRDHHGVDQLKTIHSQLLKRSNSRRLLFTAWDPSSLPFMALPPCHTEYQFSVNGDDLNIRVTQRSVDACLGLPFNLANTARLCHIMAHSTGLNPGEMVWQGSDVHIYKDHIETAMKQIGRKPRPLPKLEFVCEPKMFDAYNYEDMKLTGYTPHGKLYYPLSVG